MTLLEYGAESGHGRIGWHLMLDGERRLLACVGPFEGGRCGAGGRATVVRGRTPLTSDRWHHAALTVADTHLTLYVDGHLDGEARADAGVGSQDDIALWFRLGSTETRTAPFYGLLDEIELYNRALTPQEIQDRGK
jgi:hypothetical protein